MESKLRICVHTHAGSASSIPLPSYSKNESVVELVEHLNFSSTVIYLIDSANHLRTLISSPEPEGIGKDKPDGDGHVIGRNWAFEN